MRKNETETSCPEDPKRLLGLPIGMYHCPSCGAIVVAGFDHPTDKAVRNQGLVPFSGLRKKK